MTPPRHKNISKKRPEKRPSRQRTEGGSRHRATKPSSHQKSAAVALLYGRHAVLSALQNTQRRHGQLWATPNALETIAAEHPDIDKKVKVFTCSPQQLDQRLPPETHHQGMLLETSPLQPLSLDQLQDIAPQGPYIMLDQITDPHNGGAIIRSCKALGATGIIMTARHSPDLSSPVLAKSASGALDLIPLCQVNNLVQAMDQLHKTGVETVGLAEEGSLMTEINLIPAATCLVMGAEGKGLRRLTKERATHLAALPTAPDFSTLNVSVATALALHVVQQNR